MDSIRDVSWLMIQGMENHDSDVVKKIDDMDTVLVGNNGNFDIDWYEDIDVSLFCIENEFFYEEFSNSNIFHEDNFDPTIESFFGW